MIKTLQYLAANCESLYLRNESFISQTKAENKTTSWFLIWQGSVYYKISSVVKISFCFFKKRGSHSIQEY